MKIMSTANQKGGVAKTTTAVNLGAWYAAQGKRVLIADTDAQGHCARCLGMQKTSGLFRLIAEEAQPKDVIVNARENLDLLPCDKSRERIKTAISDQAAPGLFVAEMLTNAASGYDLMIIDLAPGSDVIHVGALIACDYFLIPANMEFLALDGVVEVINTVRSLTRIPQVTPPSLAGVVPTKFERTPNDVKDNVKRLAEVVGQKAVLPPIPKDIHVPEATSRGMTIWEYAPETSAAIGYKNGGQRTNSRGNLGGYLHLAEILAALLW